MLDVLELEAVRLILGVLVDGLLSTEAQYVSVLVHSLFAEYLVDLSVLTIRLSALELILVVECTLVGFVLRRTECGVATEGHDVPLFVLLLQRDLAVDLSVAGGGLASADHLLLESIPGILIHLGLVQGELTSELVDVVVLVEFVLFVLLIDDSVTLGSGSVGEGILVRLEPVLFVLLISVQSYLATEVRDVSVLILSGLGGHLFDLAVALRDFSLENELLLGVLGVCFVSDGFGHGCVVSEVQDVLVLLLSRLL